MVKGRAYMTNYFIYVNNQSVVEASITERQHDILIYTVECDTEDLIVLLTIAQNAIDASLIKMSEKADNLFNQRKITGNRDIN